MVTMRLMSFARTSDGGGGTVVGRTATPKWWVDGYLADVVKGKRPPDVDEPTWRTAVAWRSAVGRESIERVVEAMARANRLSPGCVYLRGETAEFVARLTVMAMKDGVAGRDAVKWLSRICTPRRQSDFNRALLVGKWADLATTVYRDVLTVRRVYRYVRTGSTTESLRKIREVFPDLNHVDDRLAKVVCGSRDAGDDSTPLDAVAAVYATITGYNLTTLKRRLRRSGYKHRRSRLMAALSADRLIALIEKDAQRAKVSEAAKRVAYTAESKPAVRRSGKAREITFRDLLDMLPPETLDLES
jgi:hypothetical protein